MKYMQINVSYKYKCTVSEREMTMSIGIIANPELVDDDDIVRKVKGYIKGRLCKPNDGRIFIGVSGLELRIVLCSSRPMFDIG
ncbi:hypothetical protein VPHF89G1_0017 [Vibrio phage F89 g1]